MRRLHIGVAVLALAMSGAGGSAETRRKPLSLDEFLGAARVSDPQVSPDGQSVVYVVTEVLKEENTTQSDLWLVAVAGGEPRRLTFSPRHDRHPRWSPDGRWIAFESNRDGEFQLWLLPANGAGEARRVTSVTTGATQPTWSPTGQHLGFVSRVFPEFSERSFAEANRRNREKLDAAEKAKVKVRVATQLLYRHWDTWSDGRRQHLFVVAMGADGTAGEPRNVTPGDNDAVPNSRTFDAGGEFAFSADGRHLAFSAPPEETRTQAWSTNYDLWSVDLVTGLRQLLTADNPAADGLPRFSPDGRWLAYRAQRRHGFEADRWELVLLDLVSQQRHPLTATWDRSIDGLTWAPDSQSLLLVAQEQGTEPIFRIPVGGGLPQPVVTGGVNNAVTVAPDGRLVFLRQHLTRPPDVATLPPSEQQPQFITHANAQLLGATELPTPESVTVPGAGGTPVQMWLLKPPGFDPARRYPLVFWVHGGPQSAFLDAWSTRWNPQMWGAQDYVIAMPNPRGSTGFGQRFTDEISRDWGGKAFEDLMACLAYVEALPYVDRDRLAAAGASYGGYMMNWFQGHTTRFKTLVTHCGVYDFLSMYGATEETWFDEWEHGVPWAEPDFARFSPHQFAGRFRTPNLIIHNELDFRVPLHQGLSLFTTLQRQGVPSRLVIFPDEGHWVLKPQNSERWHQEIFAWLREYLK